MKTPTYIVWLEWGERGGWWGPGFSTWTHFLFSSKIRRKTQKETGAGIFAQASMLLARARCTVNIPHLSFLHSLLLPLPFFFPLLFLHPPPLPQKKKKKRKEKNQIEPKSGTGFHHQELCTSGVLFYALHGGFWFVGQHYLKARQCKPKFQVFETREASTMVLRVKFTRPCEIL